MNICCDFCCYNQPGLGSGGRVAHEICSLVRRALRLLGNAMTKSMATKTFLMR